MSKKIIIFLVCVVLVLFFVFWLLFSTQNTGETFLSWNASEGDIGGYRVYYGTSPRTDSCPQGGYTENVDVGNNTQYTLTGLENNTTYYFSVTSYNSGKIESCFSEEVSKEISIGFKDRVENIITKY
ncbi:TPA: hypothetical protein DEP58_01965 [Patescibacteria group bacterium]|nr:MAG: Beta-1,3-glucanase [Parcubacteria group bacterium GW2011_GWD2_42_14]HCC05052.1 hypothetical protein [Patescibacteria group bacterium]